MIDAQISISGSSRSKEAHKLVDRVKKKKEKLQPTIFWRTRDSAENIPTRISQRPLCNPKKSIFHE